jgi:hypothetical protein
MLYPHMRLNNETANLSDGGVILHSHFTGQSHFAPGDVICICSWSNVPPLCHTATRVNNTFTTGPDYALPPNTQLTFEEVREPPWTATMRRWHRGKNESGVYFADEMSRSMTTSRPLTSSLLDRKAARTTLS